jgi:hypothetical protein
MKIERQAVQTTTDSSTSCGMSLRDHLDIAASALDFFGLGLRCETEYHALLVLAEAARLKHDFATYDPLPEAEKLLEEAAQIAEGETNAPPAYVRDNGQVH